MVTRIIGIPDEKGVIRIDCGAEEIEIKVLDGVKRRRWRSGIDIPTATLVVASRDSDFPLNKGTADALAARFLAARANPGITGPDALLLAGQKSLNLADVQVLAQAIKPNTADTAPPQIVVAFGAPDKHG